MKFIGYFALCCYFHTSNGSRCIVERIYSLSVSPSRDQQRDVECGIASRS